MQILLTELEYNNLAQRESITITEKRKKDLGTVCVLLAQATRGHCSWAEGNGYCDDCKAASHCPLPKSYGK